MKEEVELSILKDDRFLQRLRRQSRLRWCFSGILVIAYLAYSLAGIYASDILGMLFLGSSVSWGIVTGFAIMLLSLVLAIVYVCVVTNLRSSQSGESHRGGR